MPTTVAEMTPQDLQVLILTTVQDVLSEVMGGKDWPAKWRELMEHQRHLDSLYAEFAATDLVLAKAGISDYVDSLAQEDSARQNMV